MWQRLTINDRSEGLTAITEISRYIFIKRINVCIIKRIKYYGASRTYIFAYMCILCNACITSSFLLHFCRIPWMSSAMVSCSSRLMSMLVKLGGRAVVLLPSRWWWGLGRVMTPSTPGGAGRRRPPPALEEGPPDTGGLLLLMAAGAVDDGVVDVVVVEAFVVGFDCSA